MTPIEGMVGIHPVALRVEPDAATGGVLLTHRSNSALLIETVLAPDNALDLALRLIGSVAHLRREPRP